MPLTPVQLHNGGIPGHHILGHPDLSADFSQRGPYVNTSSPTADHSDSINSFSSSPSPMAPQDIAQQNSMIPASPSPTATPPVSDAARRVSFREYLAEKMTSMATYLPKSDTSPDINTLILEMIAQEESALSQLRNLQAQTLLTSSDIVMARDVTTPATSIMRQGEKKGSMKRAEAGDLEDGMSTSAEKRVKRSASNDEIVSQVSSNTQKRRMAADKLKNDRATMATDDQEMEDADPDKGITHPGILKGRKRRRREGHII